MKNSFIPLNFDALQFWSHTACSIDDINLVCRELDSLYLVARLDFKGAEGLRVTVSNKVFNSQQGHSPTVIEFFKQIHAINGNSQLEGSLVIWLEDGLWESFHKYARRIPMLVYGRSISDHYSFLIPDPAFLASDAYLKDKAVIDAAEAAIGWDNKQETLYWRGAGSSQLVSSDLWKQAPRIALSLKSLELNDNSILDAAISKVVEYPNDPIYSERIIQTGIVKDYVKFVDFLKYKYLVDADGMCCAWMSMFFKQYSHSLVFKIESEYLQWYYYLLKPWKNYIPVTAKMEEIPELVKWARANDSFCREIAEAGRMMISEINYKEARAEVFQLINELFKAQHLLQS